MAAWLPLVRLVTLLPQRLDRQLREDAGIGHVYYQVLAMLSEAPDEQLRMSELAGLTATSPSRMSHAVSALEERGWVVRCPVEQDGRGQLTRLTAAGRTAIEQLAPGHVAEVRRLVFDPLTDDEVDQLARLTTKLLGSASR
ncbi:winged helix-turn-helix transcriptional regulator [Geodermatophilus sabuli]|uniref:Winged helix-turn-helix transcriptional regulator n=2 Tax=Geodermatophilus sabuli TaxID=1564158 RepID=A0A7K3VYM1_9ACTN|nr:MarR family winged helix-turn-helix transcriptional regulator [Geodermatophilus sabuli]NEK57726.1 winged helix-turn-helix transcriptional regulator [Geodermatophilus sabuli]